MAKLILEKKYKGGRIFDALEHIENIRNNLRSTYPGFSFTAEKGDIAEAFAIETYQLTKAVTGQAGFDAVTCDGKKVSIKLIWALNAYRALHLSGGSNQKEYAYQEADILLVLGRDEVTSQMSTLYNGPLEMLEPHVKGGAIHPRLEIRILKKVYPFVPKNKRLKAFSPALPDATSVYYPKDLNYIYGIPKGYWQKLTMLWRNYPCRHILGLKLSDFLEYELDTGLGDPLLSFKDLLFLKTCYKYYEKDYDHHTSVFAAYAEIHSLPFPDLIKVGAANLKKLNIASSVVRDYKKHEFIRKHFSYFFNMQVAGPGGRALQTYLTPHDIQIFEESYAIRGRTSRGSKGGNTDKVHYIEAGKIAAKRIGPAPIFTMPYPREKSIQSPKS